MRVYDVPVRECVGMYRREGWPTTFRTRSVGTFGHMSLRPGFDTINRAPPTSSIKVCRAASRISSVCVPTDPILPEGSVPRSLFTIRCYSKLQDSVPRFSVPRSQFQDLGPGRRRIRGSAVHDISHVHLNRGLRSLKVFKRACPPPSPFSFTRTRIFSFTTVHYIVPGQLYRAWVLVPEL